MPYLMCHCYVGDWSGELEDRMRERERERTCERGSGICMPHFASKV